MERCSNCGFNPSEIGDDLPNQVIKHMNEVSGKRFRFTESSRKLILARAKDGATLGDFKHVIQNKWRQWHDTEFEKYYSPDILFNASKFERYRMEPTFVVTQQLGEPPHMSEEQTKAYRKRYADFQERMRKIREAGL